MSELQQMSNQAIQELLVIRAAEGDYCIDIHQTVGISRVIPITSVPKAPDYVRGIINLRGQVVTVLDLGIRLGWEPTGVSPQNRIIIVQDQHEDIGLLVDKVIDVIEVGSENMEPPPANLGGVQGHFFAGVYRDSSRVLGILDVPEIIRLDT